MATTQAQRQIKVETPLDRDVLLFRHMSGTEAISRLFQFDLELLSENLDIAIDSLLGKPVTVSIDLPAGGQRHFNGFVTRFSCGGQLGRLALYRATVHPWLWFLTRKADCRIFQEKTVPDIIKQVFRELGFTDFEERLSGRYRTWTYCVQYRETDFNFVSRLMEQEGISYHFTHEAGRHTLVMTDADSSRDKTPKYETIPYFPPDIHEHRHRDHISEWAVQHQVEPGKYALNDFDFKTPRKDLMVVEADPKPHDHASFEVYDYPGEYTDKGDGQSYDKTRLQELHAQFETVSGGGDARGLKAGFLFSLEGHPRKAENKEYVITSVTHSAHSDEYYSVPGGTGETVYRCSFTAMSSRIPFRPARLTPKPVVQGPQTAIVTGPAGEEIYTDEHARVTVQFHWDRQGKRDERSSCWLRVAQVWAGKQWGAMFIPRVGQEVIVEFLEGDPDQPIVTGRVYNGDNMPPYALPGNKTQSGVKTRSSKNGGTTNFNELRFEDKKGDEQVYFHAEKNFDRVVENNDTLKVGYDQTIEIKNDRTETVKDGNETVTIEKGDRTVTISMGNESLLIKMGNQETTLEMGNQTTTLKMGNQTTKLSLGKSETEALQSIELKVGGSSVKVDQLGVTIKGMMITLDGTLSTQVKGAVMTSVKGAIVSIN